MVEIILSDGFENGNGYEVRIKEEQTEEEVMEEVMEHRLWL
jgi:hypothetical protein